jgi:putative transposase
MNLDLMLLIDKQFLDTPFYGVQQMTWHLQNEGHAVNRKRIRRLVRLMRLMPIYQKPDTSRPGKGYKTYPYLLGGLRVDRPNQVWCADITYLSMRRGFLYLVAIMDRFTRKVLAWRISNTLEADFCIEALNEAIHKFGPPEIMNMEHGRAIGSIGHATSRQPVHVLRLDRPTEAVRHPDIDGRQGALHRQHLHRAPVAVHEV